MKNYIKKTVHILLSVLVFPFWLILNPLLMLAASLCPGISNKPLYQKSDEYGDKVKRHFLIGERSSRCSFTFAHGLLHFLIFLISIAAAYWLYQSYFNQSIAVKNKNLNIEIEDNGFGHIQSDSTTINRLDEFMMSWSQEDSLKTKEKYPPGQKFNHMTFIFKPVINENDTTFYRIKIHADFDLKFDTAEIRRSNINVVANRAFDYEIEKFGENDGKHYIVINLMALPNRNFTGDETDSINRRFNVIANPDMYDEDDPPYLYYYIHFSLGNFDLNSFNNSLCFSYWDGFTLLQKISDCPYFDVPYELIDAKPEPVSNRPYFLYYHDESFKDAIERGVYLKFVNRSLLQKKDHNAFFYSVIFGAIISFILTVLIELLTKWRNLNLRSGNKDPYSSN